MLKNNDDMTEKEFLKNYDSNRYEKPSVTVDMIIFTIVNVQKGNYRKLPEKKLKILMIKRKNHPFIGAWALPGGFVSIDEDLESAAERELREETGLNDIYMEQLYTWGDVNRDPRTRVISCSYMSLIDSSEIELVAGDDAEEADWFELKYDIISQDKEIIENGYKIENEIKFELKNKKYDMSALIKFTKTVKGRKVKYNREVLRVDGVAFDHVKIISYALERLRNKIEYTDIAFNLMNEEFTLTELQQVYEIILGKELLTAAFRRKIMNKVVKTSKFTKDAGHRPSQLYRFNLNWYEKEV